MRFIALAIMLLWSGGVRPARADVVLWAWERPEALEALPSSYGVAVVAGFIRVRSRTMVVARGRRFPLVMGPERAQPIGVVHIEIDQGERLDWTETLQTQIIDAALSFARGYRAVQVDMEVRESQRGTLLNVLRDVRAGLAPGTTLSMTALASWCDTEHWIAAAPVDEIVPMLFRMGRDGYRLRARLASGGDFGEPRCRTAPGISADAPVAIPPGRRVYIFKARPWDAAALSALESEDIR